MTRNEARLIRRLVSMACHSVLVSDKLAGYHTVDIQEKLVSKYKLYFDFDMRDEQLLSEAVECMKSKIRQEKDDKNRFLLFKCLKRWFLS